MNGSRLQTLYVIKSTSITKTALTINLVLILLRLVGYARSFICGDADFYNLHHWSTMLLIPYAVYLASFLMASVPNLDIHEKELLGNGDLNLNEVFDSKLKNSKEFSNTNTDMYGRYLEVYLSSVFIGMFMFKDEYRAFGYSIVTLTVLSVSKLWISNTMKDAGIPPNYESGFGTGMLFKNIKPIRAKKSDKLLAGRSNSEILGDKHNQNVLELFPSGIVFFSRKSGVFYRNKFWNDIIKSVSKAGNFELWGNKSAFSVDSEAEDSAFNRFEELNTDDQKTEALFMSLYHKENNNQTLSELLDKINLMLLKEVNENESQDSEVNEFIDTHNNSFNEYEIKDINGKTIKEFSIKISPINISSEGTSLMVVFNDISERTRLKEIRISEGMKTIMLCSLSHELRSPLNQINGVLSLIQPTLKNEEQQKLLKIANSSTEMLKIKINDMLDYYEIETKGFKPDIVR